MGPATDRLIAVRQRAPLRDDGRAWSRGHRLCPGTGKPCATLFGGAPSPVIPAKGTFLPLKDHRRVKGSLKVVVQALVACPSPGFHRSLKWRSRIPAPARDEPVHYTVQGASRHGTSPCTTLCREPPGTGRARALHCAGSLPAPTSPGAAFSACGSATHPRVTPAKASVQATHLTQDQHIGAPEVTARDFLQPADKGFGGLVARRLCALLPYNCDLRSLPQPTGNR